MEMTIKQLADELEVCKQTVNNVILQLGMQNELYKVGNRYMLSEEQINQIKQHLKDKIPKSTKLVESTKMLKSANLGESTKTPKSTNLGESAKSLIETEEDEKKVPIETQNLILQGKLSILDKQLAIKDHQIQMLQEQLIAKDSQIAEKDRQIQLLQEQLITKDNQIGQITVAMENMTTALTAAQALHAGTIQKTAY